ncbi:MAG: LysR family transcriptional regulator [Myxococcales bacterium]|nr:LysR family transcriptional regulator [Myxococcales bacterium]MCB9753050.1 LysR family transcriptional regulator [Myxococcales bacterium]
MDPISDMSIFVSVVDEGSISASARALGLPRSTISRRLSALEDRLQVTLLQRTTRKLRLTEAGRIFHQRCARILDETARAEAEVRELDTETAGVLRVGIPSGVGTEWFRVQIGEFFDRYPDIRLELITDHRARDIHDEDLDLALVRGPLPDSLLVARRIAPADLLCVAAPRYLERGPPLRSPADLQAHRCMIALHDDFDGDRWPLLHGEHVRVVPRLATNDMHYLREALLAATGVALVPWISVVDELASGALAPVLLDSVGERGSSYFAVYAPESRHIAKVAATVEFLVEFFARHFGPHPRPWS